MPKKILIRDDELIINALTKRGRFATDIAKLLKVPVRVVRNHINREKHRTERIEESDLRFTMEGVMKKKRITKELPRYDLLVRTKYNEIILYEGLLFYELKATVKYLDLGNVKDDSITSFSVNLHQSESNGK